MSHHQVLNLTTDFPTSLQETGRMKRPHREATRRSVCTSRCYLFFSRDYSWDTTWFLFQPILESYSRYPIQSLAAKRAHSTLLNQHKLTDQQNPIKTAATSPPEHIPTGTHPTDSSPEHARTHWLGSTSGTLISSSSSLLKWANCKARDLSWGICSSPPQESFLGGFSTVLWGGCCAPLRDPCWLPRAELPRVLPQHCHGFWRRLWKSSSPRACPEIAAAWGPCGRSKHRDSSCSTFLLLFLREPSHFLLGHTCRVW